LGVQIPPGALNLHIMGIIDELKKTKNMKELDKIMELASSYTNASNSTKRKWLRVYKTKKELLEKS
jgi:hypothetical protein